MSTRNRSAKRSKLSPPIESDDVEAVEVIKPSNLCYDVVPEAGRGDIFTHKSDDSFELFLLCCAGCSTGQYSLSSFLDTHVQFSERIPS